jgi:hypothetical protein
MSDPANFTLRSRVVNAADAADNPALKEDNYVQKVVRYIPGEIVAVYTTAYGLVLSTQGIPTVTILWIVIGVLAVLTPFWLYYATAIPGRKPPVFQIVTGTLAYLVWVFALAGATLFPWYNPLYGSLLLLLFTLVAPIAEKAFVRA